MELGILTEIPQLAGLGPGGMGYVDHSDRPAGIDTLTSLP